MESLSGSFLIATPGMPDPRFKEKVVYLCSHNQEGAMGIVINQPISEVQLEDIFVSAGITLPEPRRPLGPVYLGGPVDTNCVFMLYSNDYSLKNEMNISSTVALSRDPQLLYDLVLGKGPEHLLVCLGYAGWGAGQLEQELGKDGWLVLPAVDDIIFNTPDEEKWRSSAKAHGIDVAIFSNMVGSA